ncbi:hypothetical protein Desca_1055 [Desulfotomaculum nigrificans CO-1-SRB]|uniref:Uncharacterized protein n=1 Tax=Desulfotomaculum nigrificans (strain DSM 14880 / VKM B-2319 / CO-1-SRB) TaxID=868595 RepID=F6B321_DESCC|nr:hypothetical protein [Desulfotomaculum nigrificans]AEF93925.1 hypothetical protein Desca_1055 [Desulfotomaculum nigrificans CO-1-SRB]
MLKCCVCGKEDQESRMIWDEEMDNSYCENCYLKENSKEISS